MKKGKIVLADDREIHIDFYPEAAPITVQNFEQLAQKGFYDGLTFHRVIPGFVAQGGCPDGTGRSGSGETIPCETEGNPHQHQPGSLSMAHAGKDTGSSQFFIVHERQPHLDGVHTVFGQVTTNMEDVLNIQAGDQMKQVVVWEE
ncbi:peptidyl-prolyl cis-trans isomerase B (cyclophilin B) [Salsuginibacillus halophilus]|uniref:Peptidyl-prolyl cis-trans isomerase n=1 Tax=Salsuginibacillus halophilus TaxID=517424 RepID=A0A2P8HBN7_9BACI|nr:peptidylprolyl isomerase [Salsuginibacillus halophilus]PSL43633.1 peptidyl-prolyl cis-trans isomerase B (cyclophilin B) [Salsuginibacillus halophilus]